MFEWNSQVYVKVHAIVWLGAFSKPMVVRITS